MSWLAIILLAIFWGYKALKEARRPKIPASFWRNEELMTKDKMDPNIPPEQVMKNLEKGKYYLSDEEYERRQKR